MSEAKTISHLNVTSFRTIPTLPTTTLPILTIHCHVRSHTLTTLIELPIQKVPQRHRSYLILIRNRWEFRRGTFYNDTTTRWLGKWIALCPSNVQTVSVGMIDPPLGRGFNIVIAWILLPFQIA